MQLLDRLRFLLFSLALLLFPDALWQPRWTVAVAAATVCAFLLGIGEELHVLATHLFLPVAICSVLAGIGSLVVRFRRTADYALKQQLKWVEAMEAQAGDSPVRQRLRALGKLS